MDSDRIQDLFQELGPVRTRKMFGGLGVYAGDRMFALVASGDLYLKVDDGTRPAFEAAGSRPFIYDKDGRAIAMSYWLLPGEAFDDPTEAARWGRLAIEAAGRSSAPKQRKPAR